MVTNVEAWPALELDERTSRGLARAVSAAIAQGTLPEGSRLPPIRTLAARLGLSPSTVSGAWTLLARAGTIRTDGRRGTTVAPRGGPGPARYRQALGGTHSFALDLSGGVPDADLLPDLGPSLEHLHRAWTSSTYLDDPVVADLDEVLRADWPYDPPGLAITDGAMDAIDLVASAQLRYGDTVVVEHPSFPPLLDLLDALGARTLGVPVDEHGMLPDHLSRALDTRPRAVFLQPRAHNPTGATLNQQRAEHLAALLAPCDATIVEDDSAGAISSTPPISLGRWLPQHTTHIRSFSKSHGPDLRIAAVSAPDDLLSRVNERRRLGQGWTSRLLQMILLDLLTRPAAQTQVDAARVRYAERRHAIVSELARLDVPVTAGDGINLWLPVQDEAAALLHLASRGIGAAAGQPFTTLPDRPHLRITVGLITTDFAAVATHLADASRTGPWGGPR